MQTLIFGGKIKSQRKKWYNIESTWDLLVYKFITEKHEVKHSYMDILAKQPELVHLKALK